MLKLAFSGSSLQSWANFKELTTFSIYQNQATGAILGFPPVFLGGPMKSRS
jgi:hypothetical protein